VTAVAARFTVRVTVTDVWDTVVLPVEGATPVVDLKHEALARALKRPDTRAEEYVVKFHGALITDESVTIAALGAGPNAPFIILPAKKQAAR
jgi:hypothetical protein